MGDLRLRNQLTRFLIIWRSLPVGEVAPRDVGWATPACFRGRPLTLGEVLLFLGFMPERAQEEVPPFLGLFSR